MALFERLGFDAHPFAKTNADEEPNLDSYFVPPPFYDAVTGDAGTPNASLVLAPRGGGKTALRRMLEKQAYANSYLAVTYDRFEFGADQRLADITLQYHLRNIITRILVSYLSYLAESPDLLVKLDKRDRSYVSLFTHTYLGKLTGASLQELIKELRGMPEKFREFWHNNVGFLESVVNLLLKKYNLEPIDLPDAKQEEKTLSETYKHQLSYLRDLVKRLGFKAIYVLVDKLDESEHTGNDAEAAYALLRPMLRDLELLGLSGYGFKFFVWDKISEHHREDARPDRIHQYRLEWSREQLQKVLRERLRAFSSGRKLSFRDICDDGIPFDIDAAICLVASKSPRNVIRLCEKIYAAQSDLDDRASSISSTAIDNGTLAYCEQVSNDTYGEDMIRELQRVGRELFTVNYLANDVFKVEANSVRNKITSWTNAGLVKQIGSLAVDTSRRPLNLYYVIDPAVVRLIHRTMSLEDILRNMWLPCSSCRADNLMDLSHFTGDNQPICAGCGRNLIK